MGSPTTPQRDAVIAAMPWYDDSDPDYTELDAAIAAIEEAAARDALDRVRAAVEAIQPWPDNTLPRNEVLAILEPNIEDTMMDLGPDGTAYPTKDESNK